MNKKLSNQLPQQPYTVDPWAQTRPIRVRKQSSRSCTRFGCLSFIFLFACLAAGLLVFLITPARTNLLVIGIDRAPEGTNISRSDTNILVTVLPLKPYVGMLSIPRDLWVNIPGIGENRINTAHFWAENNQPGTGPEASMDTVRENFGVTLEYYVRIRFDGLEEIVNAMGGLEIVLEEPMSGYPAGAHRLTGEQALAFVRDRSGTDDFFRMSRGQLFLRAAFKQMLNPIFLPRLPMVLNAVMASVDTNLPIWHWPRFAVAVLLVGPDGIDNRVISREMVFPFTTNQGAQVLAPNWEAINPVLLEMFGE